MNTTDTTLDQLVRNVKALRDDLERLVRLDDCEAEQDDLDWLTANAGDLGIDETGIGPWVYLWNLPLEVVHHASRRSDSQDWEYTHTVIVFTTGGPHIELDTATRTITGRWGSDNVVRSVDRSVADFYESDC